MLEIVTGILFFLIFLLIVTKSSFFTSSHFSRKTVFLAYSFRLTACVAFYLVYTYYYPVREEADMYRYFDDGKIMYSSLPDHPSDYLKMLTGVADNSENITRNYYMKMNTWYKSYERIVPNDNRIMVRLNAFFMLFTFGSFYGNTLIFMFLAFTGLFMIYKTISPLNPFLNRFAFYLLMFFPSLVFWTAGISKEAFVIFAGGGFLFLLKQLSLRPFRTHRLLLTFIFLFFLVSLKIYVLLCLIPVMIAYAWSVYNPGKRYILRFVVVFSFYIFFLWNFSVVVPDYNLVETFARQQWNFINHAHDINAGSFVSVTLLQPDILSFIKAVPAALVLVLFRPFFFDSTNVFMHFVSVENLFFILFMVTILFSVKKNFKAEPLFLACIGFSLFFFLVVGMATPVSGAVVRYKIIGYPFLFIALVNLIDDKRFRNIISLKKSEKNE